ncbi:MULTISPECIES: acetate/propionate family kinase [Caproicibacterium]|uniref:Acetate kinase n=1 Tax=Caproicibacterium lactatifermentans TaxID=2666138 RepID=A0A859DRT7_9FIRM|nr:acetate kinase [Caproicibacterium lactatifermentans]ARP50010.1 acetate kinase [Ruminococcaceae bacterium CPB6]MDD4807974.1 acetate kinase [Oscillospiraceae bacterium]QKN24209.1 acetate/propionate family kinase [Caproicibacterium lactatifermentans]QKO30722.1 acetate/propionate family kinase [Caproicibacterium lactatifermentans]
MKVLVINAGSSSLKYQLIDMDTEKMMCKGNCERIGQENGHFGVTTADGRKMGEDVSIPNHKAAFEMVTKVLVDKTYGVIKDLSEVSAIGHRIVQGGDLFKSSVLVTDEVKKGIESLIPLAPLHNRPELDGINACQEVFGKDMPEVVVFDTSFHSTMPAKAFIYPIPWEYYEKYKIRRYGFHGTSHRYVSMHVAHLMHEPIEDLKIISCHIGNGSSITAIEGGKVVDTSMGLTPLDGFMMGTRSGSLDPSVVTYIMKEENLTPDQMDNILNRKSGMLGVSGYADDRDVTNAEIRGEHRSILTHQILNYQIAKFIGAYAAAMNGVDVITFEAGIGENQPVMRYNVCRYLHYMGVKIDGVANDATKLGKEGKISAFDSLVPVYVINTNEELMIARDTRDIVDKLTYAKTEDKTVVDPEDI